MFLELIAAVFAGVAAAGVAMLARRLSGGRLPGWVMPVAAGATMILFAVSMEYSWFRRTSADFPPDVVIAEVHEVRALWRPWTYLAPLVDRFVAFDAVALRSNPAVPHQRIVELMFFGRWQPVRLAPMVIDCDAHRAAPLSADVSLEASGAIGAADWAPLPEGDATFTAVCKEIRP